MDNTWEIQCSRIFCTPPSPPAPSRPVTMVVNLVPLIAHPVSSLPTLFLFFFRLPTNNLDTGFHGFFCVFKRRPRWFLSFKLVLRASHKALPDSSSSELVSVVWRLQSYLSKLFTLALHIKSNFPGPYFKPLILTIPASSFSLHNSKKENLAMPDDLLTRWKRWNSPPPFPSTK